MKENISYDDFAKLDLRVGEVIDADLPEWSDKLLRYQVDFGDEIGKRTMFSGIRKWYGPEDLIGKKYVFVVNMAPKKMGPEESQGMMIMADTLDGNPGDVEKPILIAVGEEIEVGTVVR